MFTSRFIRRAGALHFPVKRLLHRSNMCGQAKNDIRGDESLSAVEAVASNSAAMDKRQEQLKNYADIVEQVRVANEYFSQYVDEYYEEEQELDSEEMAAMDLPTNEERMLALSRLYEQRLSLPLMSEVTAEEVVELLRQQRAKNIVCLCMPPEKDSINDYIIICEAHNMKHAESVVINIRKFIKDNYRFGIHNMLPRRIPGAATPEWFNIDLRSVIVHVLTKRIRVRYNLEALYGADDMAEETYYDVLQPQIGGMNLAINSKFLPP